MSSSTTKTTTVYLIRHAESEENRRLGALQNLLFLRSKAWMQDATASVGLLNVAAQIDSPVSDKGKSQIAQIRQQIQESQFVKDNGIAQVYHSPLQRARDTAVGLFETTSSEHSNLEFHELNCLREKTPTEWISIASLDERVRELHACLKEKQQSQPIVLVGHSQYWKHLLQLDFKFGNCDVWKVQYDSAATDATEASTNSYTHAPTGRVYPLPAGWSQLEPVFGLDLQNNTKESSTTSDEE